MQVLENRLICTLVNQITGAGHGMGREMALRFGKLGAEIVCVDINPSGNKETMDVIKSNKGKAYRYELVNFFLK